MNSRRHTFRSYSFVVLTLVLLGVIHGTASTTYAELLANPSFEQGDVTLGWYGISNWSSGSQWGGVLVTTNNAHDGTNVMRMFAFGPSSQLLEQRNAASAGLVYEASGWLKSATGSDTFNPVNGYCTILLQFYNASGSKIGANCDSVRMRSGGPTSWTRYTTGPCLAPAGTVTTRVGCLYVSGGDSTSAGWVYYDDMSAVTSQASQAGALLNNDFEVQPTGAFADIPYWDDFGDAGAAVTNYSRNGRYGLQIWWTENLLGQSWSATPGKKYASSGYMFTPSAGPFASTTNASHGVILLQYLDASSNVLQTFETAYFTTSSPTDTWVYAEASGFAPVGTVYGRTMCAVLGSDAGFGGSICFDDLTQWEVSTGSTVAGLLYNPGYEDGPSGNAYDLYQSTNLPNWVWLGGTNGGFINQSQATEGSQSLSITYPANLSAQSYTGTAGRSYVLSGKIYNPAAEDFQGSAYGSLYLEFYNGDYNNGTSVVSVLESSRFIASSANDSWIKFSVTNRAPWSGSITSRVLCAILGDDTSYAGALYFDDLSVYETNIPISNTKTGELWNPGFEYTSPGTVFEQVDNWQALGVAGNVDNVHSRSGDNALKIYAPETLMAQSWDATPGYKYSSAAYAFTPSGTDEFDSATNTHGVLLLQYLDATGTNVLQTYESAYFTTGSTAGVWSDLSVTGRAPMGAVSGRTVVAILGLSTGYAGAIWFDDVSQALVSTGGTTQAGLLYNPGFDDGLTGDAFFLSNSLPHWTWYGGSNAGFVVDTVSQSNDQSLVIVWPNNLASQDFEAETGMSYVVDGYMMTPSGADRMTSTTAYATFLLEFFTPQGGVTSISVVSTAQLTDSSPTDTWIKFGVTNHAPWSGAWVTGRVSCALLDLEGTPYGGVVYFDSVSVTETNIPISNTQSGAIWNPGFEYTANGTRLQFIDNWEALGLDGGVAADHVRSGAHALQITYPETLLAQYWPVTGGYRYSTEAYVSTPSGVGQFTSSTNAHAVMLLQYLDATGTNILATYESEYFTGSATPNTWSNLAVSGIAPQGAVTGRTVCAILGLDDAFSGSVWFDDVSQALVSTGNSQAGEIYNGGFDDGITGDAYFLSNDLPHWVWFGGSNAGFVANTASQSNDQSLVIVWPNNLASQDFEAETGMSYVVEGYMMTPSGVDRMTGTTAYATFLLEFFSDANGPTSVSSVATLDLTDASPTDTWIKFGVTNRAPWTGAWVTGRVSCALLDLEGTPYGGVVYFDSVRVTETNIPLSNSQSGQIWNPGFEYTANGTKLQYIDSWEGLGFDGGVGDGHVRSGGRALQITYPETLLSQSWPATGGYRYSTEGYVSTPAGADQFTSSTNAHAVILLQYLDATGTNIVASYESEYFTGSATPNTWSNLAVSGVAPQDAVSGRTLCAILGLDDAFGGIVWFDDISQSLVSTGGSSAGIIYNGGFDDGITGDAYYLSNNLPNWAWYGGSNAGFIASTESQSNDQSLVIVWPNNLAGQDFEAETGMSYVVEGYMMTPSGADQMTSTTAYATFLLEYFTDANGPTSVSVVASANLTDASPTDTWIKFGVTNRAPWTGAWVTGRVSCALLDLEGTPYGGVVYFDSIRVTETNIPINNSQGGALWNPGFEYTANGTKLPYMDNWEGLGLAGNVDSTQSRTGDNALKIYAPETLSAQSWDATPGYKYSSEAYAFTPSGDDRFMSSTNAHAVVLLQFLDATGTNVLLTYESPYMDGSAPADVWSNLYVRGVAPAGTVSGRTVVAILGPDDAYAGAVWFDDAHQSLVSTQPSENGLIKNPGFDDNPTGNAYDLDADGVLPAWVWGGGTNAGFVGRDVQHNEEQAMVITYPQNSMYQDFTVSDSPASGNLLTNPGFEIGPAGGGTPDGWFKSGALGQENWAAESGSNGVVFYSWSAGNWGFIGQDVNVNDADGNVYTFTINGLAETNFSSSSGEAYLKLEFWKNGEGANRYAITNDIYDTLILSSNTWGTYTVSYTNTDSAVDLVKVVVGYGNASDTGGDQAAKWDNATFVQSIDLSQSKTIVASGYLLTPSTAKFNSDGSSYGEIVLSFYVNGSPDAANEFTVNSSKFSSSQPADTWVYFAVTGAAPAEAIVTGRLTCTISSADPQGDFDLAGVIWFDDFMVVQSGTQTGVTEFSQWQLHHFGTTTGDDVGPYDDYDGEGYLNWEEFIAGTQPTNTNSVLEVAVPTSTSLNEFIIQWPSTSNRYYTLTRSTNVMSGAYTLLASDIAATVPMNSYTDNVPSLVETYYYKLSVTTNQP